MIKNTDVCTVTNAKANEVKISMGGKLIDVQNVVYIESDGRYSIFFTSCHKKIVVCKCLKDIERLSDFFWRIHKSFVINTMHITNIENQRVVLCNEFEVPFSRIKKI